MAKKTVAKSNTGGETMSNVEEEKTVPESISLNDLQLLLQIVDLSSNRGAFRGAELTTVGAIYDKLNAFLSYVADQQKSKLEAESAAAAE
jgi:hypothetical protein